MEQNKKLEKKDRPYSVESYNPKWKEIFETEKEKLSEVFGHLAIEIEHIGSTSVPRMFAKPQIDIMVVVNNFDFINDEFVKRMEEVDYSYRGTFSAGKDDSDLNEEYFVRDGEEGERLISLHVIKEDCSKISSHLSLRDYLRKHPEDRDLYSSVKRKSFEEGADRVEYSKRKKDTVLGLLAKAKKWYYLKNIK